MDRKTSRGLIILLLFFLSCYTELRSQLTNLKLTPEEKILGLSRFWSESKYTFANFDNIPGLNWDSVYQSFIPKALATRTTFEYIQVLQRMCGLLKDGHSAILEGFSFYYDSTCSPPLHVKNYDHKPYVVCVPDSLKSRIPPGSEIIAINDKNANEFLHEDVFPFDSESTEEGLWTNGIERMLNGMKNSSVKLTIRKPGSMSSATVTLKRNYPLNRIRELEGFDPPMHLKWLPGNVAYIRILVFSQESLVRYIDSLAPSLLKASGVIIDIRDNTGGNDDYAAAVVRHFTNVDTIRGIAVFGRHHIGPRKAWARSNPEYKDFLDNKAMIDLGNGDYANTKGKKITAPVVILIDTRTRSASEDFLVMMQTNRKVTLIGERSGGTTGQPYFFTLVGPIRACICSVRNTYPGGKKFVGVGIKPDIEIKNSITDFLNNRDTVLERALNFLKTGK